VRLGTDSTVHAEAGRQPPVPSTCGLYLPGGTTACKHAVAVRGRILLKRDGPMDENVPGPPPADDPRLSIWEVTVPKSTTNLRDDYDDLGDDDGEEFCPVRKTPCVPAAGKTTVGPTPWTELTIIEKATS